MTANISISNEELAKALAALGRPGSCVYSAEKKGAVIVIMLCGDREPLRYKPPAKRKPKRTATAPQ
jgi:hypothetical protein